MSNIDPATTESVVQQGTLFELPVSFEKAPLAESAPGSPRLKRANREQALLLPMHFDTLIPEDHEARAVWEFVNRLDLKPLEQTIRSVEGHAGRSATDPAIFLALWLYATLDGVGSARHLEELCENHNAYRWLCGGVSVNYHSLSDFRSNHGDFLDQLLTHSVATLQVAGLVEMKRVAQDGMRVRASAGASSFRRRPTLEKALQEAHEQVHALRAELESDPSAASRRQHQARLRAVQEREDRINAALAQMPTVEEQKKANRKDVSTARVSTTDPEARVIKMPDGGFRPGYNVQFATDTETQVIVGVDTVNAGSDQGQMEPMVEQIQQRHDQQPQAMLVDGGFVTHEDIETLSAQGCVVYAPVPVPRTSKRQATEARRDDSPAVAAWRQRMGTTEAKAIYQQRAATAECVNAQARNRGLYQFLVRGLIKVRAVALWYAVAHNLRRIFALNAGLVVQTRL
jgi:transposase